MAVPFGRFAPDRLYPRPANADCSFGAPPLFCLQFLQCTSHHNYQFVRLGNLVDRIAQSPGGAAYRQDLIGTMQNGQPLFASPGLRAALGQLRAAEPYCCYCPTCQVSHLGRANPLCKKCQGRGWTTRAAYESCPESDREGILHLRSLSTN